MRARDKKLRTHQKQVFLWGPTIFCFTFFMFLLSSYFSGNLLSFYKHGKMPLPPSILIKVYIPADLLSPEFPSVKTLERKSISLPWIRWPPWSSLVWITEHRKEEAEARSLFSEEWRGDAIKGCINLEKQTIIFGGFFSFFCLRFNISFQAFLYTGNFNCKNNVLIFDLNKVIFYLLKSCFKHFYINK